MEQSKAGDAGTSEAGDSGPVVTRNGAPKSRQERRALAARNRKLIQGFPDELTEMDRESFQAAADKLPKGHRPIRAWRNKWYLVQLYVDPSNGMRRLSVCRTQYDPKVDRWGDGITWEELQALKHDAGFGDCCAVEIYPRDADVVNVANMRHLWLLDQGKHMGWIRK